MIKHFKTSTLKDYMSLAGELGMLEGKSRTDNVLAELWKQHGADTCVVYEEKLDGEVSWGVTNYNTALSEGKVVTVYTTDNVLPNDLNKADKLDEYADNLRELKEDLAKGKLKNNKDLYHDTITSLEQTYLAKNKDYGNSFEESLEEYGEVAGLVRIGDKFNRAKNLSKNKANVTDESKIDTYLDMANYCIMQAMWLMKKDVQK